MQRGHQHAGFPPHFPPPELYSKGMSCQIPPSLIIRGMAYQASCMELGTECSQGYSRVAMGHTANLLVPLSLAVFLALSLPMALHLRFHAWHRGTGSTHNHHKLPRLGSEVHILQDRTGSLRPLHLHLPKPVDSSTFEGQWLPTSNSFLKSLVPCLTWA